MNLGNDKEFTILELAETVRKMYAAKKLRLTFKPLPKDDPIQRRPDLSFAKKAIAPWQPRIHLSEGLHAMAQWLSSEIDEVKK
jgi:UDP-glucuronate decarboxylase